MPSPATLADATLFAAGALALALASMWIARPLRRPMLAMIIVLLAGLMLLAAFERFGPADAHDPIAIALREFALLLIALGVIRVAMMFVFQGIFARAHIPRILTDVLFALALIAYALYRMRVGGVNLAGIITTSAVITGVLAFSLQETLGNLWGGISLQLDNTCRLGDWIRVDGITGQIVGIRWRCVAVATNDGETVMIPNAQLIKNKVMVLGRRGDVRTSVRRRVPFRVPYTTEPRRVIAIVEEALARAEIPHVMRQPAPICTTEATEDSGIRFAVLYWLDDLLYDVQTDASVLAHALAALVRNDIEWPVPRRIVMTLPDVDDQREASAAQRVRERSAVLAGIGLFAAFTEEERAELASRLTDARYVDGDVISQQGDASDSLFVLASGHVKVLRDGYERRGERRLLGELEAPSYFGEMGLLTGDPRTATIIAVGDVLCYRLSRDAFDSVLKARPELVDGLSQTIATRRAENDATLRALDEAARARHASTAAAELVRRIRSFFDLG
jgi:small-conductance mechanosensitive channel/CRP-like cAMP-binding protein